jgi:ferredoxin
MLAAAVRRVAWTAATTKPTTRVTAVIALTTRRPGPALFHASAAVAHGSGKDLKDAPRITLHWVGKKGEEFTTDGIVGESILDAAHRHEVELEGACEGVCACSTCHVILEDPVFEKLDDPSEEEEDMLDQAFGLTPTSRLGCQVELTQALDRMKIKLPTATRNFYIDGHVPKPH